MAKKTYVLDTSVCLSDSNCIYQYANNDIILPLKVLEEIDKHKKRQDGVGIHARGIIRTLDELRAKGSLEKGVRIQKGKGILRVRKTSDALEDFAPDLTPSVPDHVIIAAAIDENESNGNRKTPVSRDINMRVICDAVGITSEDYCENQIIKRFELFTGFTEILADDQTIDHFYAEEPIFIDREETPDLNPNQFVMLVSSSEKDSSLQVL